MADHDVIVLGSEVWRVGVLPSVGASLAFGQIADEDGWVDFLRPTDMDATPDPSTCSSFVMAPWSNRIRDGVLRFEGRQWRLRLGKGLATAIHGTAREFGWDVAAVTATMATLAFDSRDVVGANFPWPFAVEIAYAVGGNAFSVTTTLTNLADEPFPAGFGHHPYFCRTLAGQADEVRLQIPCRSNFRLNHAIPDGPAGPIESRVDFRAARTLGTDVIDDCLTGREPGLPLRFVYPRSRHEIELTADPLFEHVVLFVPQRGRTDFAVEPVTNANDGFALYERGIPGSGVFVLEPGESKSAAFTLTVLR